LPGDAVFSRGSGANDADKVEIFEISYGNFDVNTAAAGSLAILFADLPRLSLRIIANTPGKRTQVQIIRLRHKRISNP
jgi:hypothetical protein